MLHFHPRANLSYWTNVLFSQNSLMLRKSECKIRLRREGNETGAINENATRQIEHEKQCDMSFRTLERAHVVLRALTSYFEMSCRGLGKQWTTIRDIKEILLLVAV
ncbi:hypothetical protein SNE40_000420 [Patella caerulea]|uniref:Uncharacterized protein n=1 Tax=Patella caerulea TaxID=87958 RepID=A0AAN8KC69_PATCE